jgi:hypothetical protein
VFKTEYIVTIVVGVILLMILGGFSYVHNKKGGEDEDDV